jgi:hypothetical protein
LTLFLKVLEKQQETAPSAGLIAQKMGSNMPAQTCCCAANDANQGFAENRFQMPSNNTAWGLFLS